MKLTEEQIQEYQVQGLIKVKLPTEIQQLQQAFLNECCLWLEKWVHFKTSPEMLDADLAKLAQTHRSELGKLYKASRRFVAVKQLACHEFFVTIVKKLMMTELVSCCHFVATRMDLPQESKFLLDCHQDFPYIQGSLNGITVWMPFHKVSCDMGAPSWIPSSHDWGMLKVEEYSLDQVGGSGGKSFRIIDCDCLDQTEFIRDEIQKDEALVFHTLLIHRSEANISNKARISVQLRFDDLLNQESYQKNYPEGLYLNNKLSTSYPEYVVERKKNEK